MAPEDRRDGPDSGKDDLEGRDLLVGRPEGAEGRQTVGTAATPRAAISPQLGANDPNIRKILETVRATAARIDALHDAPRPEDGTAEALARETAALTKAVEDACGALAKAAELAAQQDRQVTAGAQALAKSVAALRKQGEALDKRLRATGGQAEAAAQGIAEMKEAAAALDNRLRTHAEEVLRAAQRQRWRPWVTGLAIGAASFVFFVLGAVLQRETDVVSFGDPRQEWNKYVEEHYTPTLAACTSRARHHDRIIRCLVHVGPARGWTVPLYPDVNLEKVPPDEIPDLEAEL